MTPNNITPYDSNLRSLLFYSPKSGHAAKKSAGRTMSVTEVNADVTSIGRRGSLHLEKVGEAKSYQLSIRSKEYCM